MTPNARDRREADSALNAAMDAAGDAADKTAKTRAPVVPMKGCNRCAGKGYAHFTGGDRAPGVCFKCNGKGVVPSTKEGAKILADHADKIELTRCRVLWTGINNAIKVAEVSGLCSDHSLAFARRQLASVERMGKEVSRRMNQH